MGYKLLVEIVYNFDLDLRKSMSCFNEKGDTNDDLNSEMKMENIIVYKFDSTLKFQLIRVLT